MFSSFPLSPGCCFKADLTQGGWSSAAGSRAWPTRLSPSPMGTAFPSPSSTTVSKASFVLCKYGKMNSSGNLFLPSFWFIFKALQSSYQACTEGALKSLPVCSYRLWSTMWLFWLLFHVNIPVLSPFGLPGEDTGFITVFQIHYK